MRHKDDATCNNPIEGSAWNKNLKPKAALQGKSVGKESCNAVLIFFNMVNITNPSCANPKNLFTTAFIDSAPSTSHVQNLALADVATIQEQNFFLTMPNGGNMTKDTTICLHLSKLPLHARLTFCLKNLQPNLLAVSELSDVGCTVIFQKHGLEGELNGEKILQGWRDAQSRLWRVQLTNDNVPPQIQAMSFTLLCLHHTTAQSQSIYDFDKTKQLMEFYHATFFSPTKSTLVGAITPGYLRGCPDLSMDSDLKIIQGTETATVKGHLNQKRQGGRSTAIKDDQPLQEPGNIKTHHVFIILSHIEGKIYSGQTGHFSIQCSCGNKYVVIECQCYLFLPH